MLRRLVFIEMALCSRIEETRFSISVFIMLCQMLDRRVVRPVTAASACTTRAALRALLAHFHS